MSFGQRLNQARKTKNMSQEELASILGTKGPAIGRYERDEMKPSIEVASNMADILNVSLDWLTGRSPLQLDQAMINRVSQLQQLSEQDKQHILYTLDAMLRDAKTRKAYSS
ncbi:MAG: XRE family transcriptional regulator [Balneola sp.]|nr:MAG: XRE family transcriptional regulator [Balneola sp.]RNC79877.1 MAG: XRE family transcriptional regulator [Balneola sp.]